MITTASFSTANVQWGLGCAARRFLAYQGLLRDPSDNKGTTIYGYVLGHLRQRKKAWVQTVYTKALGGMCFKRH